MATIIPRNLSGHRCSREVAVVFRTLRKLDDDFTVWLSLDAHHRTRPHFFVLFQERYGFVIQVAATSQQLAESAVQADFLSPDVRLTPDSLGAKEADILGSFVSSLESEFGPLTTSGLPVRKLVVFPDVRHQTIDEIVLQRSRSTNTCFLGLNHLAPTDFRARLCDLASAAIPEPALIHLRGAFDPGSVVPPAFSPLAVQQRNNAATLTKQLLDLDQEWCVKNDLYLPSEQERLLSALDSRIQLVTGVAGCGKSLVLLYRALLSARLHPDARILILTHNKPLRAELERRFHLIGKPDLQVEWRTFFSWAAHCLRNWPEREVLSPHKCKHLIERLLPDHPELAANNPDYLLDEISWIKDLNLRTKKDYLHANRTGRGKSIDREAVWELFRSYQETLRKQNLIDWPGVAMRFHEAAIVQQRLGFPRYDFIFVDEAQFFAKSWFEVIQAALTPGGHLFLAADPTQGFLRRRQSWLASGIEVRGRTTRLKQPYRNSRAILLFAASFYQARATAAPEALREEDLNIPTAEQISAIEVPGALPQIIRAASVQDMMSRACNELVHLQRSGHPNGQVLVLHTRNIYSDLLHRNLVAALGSPALVHNAKDGPLPESAFCQHTTLNAATGLEAPIVFLLGPDALFESEDDPRLTPDQKAELLRDHTRQLYMAFTRAAQRLVIICRHDATKNFLENLVAT